MSLSSIAEHSFDEVHTWWRLLGTIYCLGEFQKSSIVYNDDQLSQVIYEHRDELTFLKNGRPSADSMKLIIREHLDGHTLGINRSGALRNQFEIEHPEIKAPDPES